MDGLFGYGLVDVLCCGGDSLEEDLRWGPRLGASVDLVEFADGVHRKANQSALKVVFH